VFVATFTDRASAGPAEFRDLRPGSRPRSADPGLHEAHGAHGAQLVRPRERLLYKRLGASMHRPL